MSESVKPTVLSVSSDNSSTSYSAGSNISINVEFDESVYVTGNPRIKLEIDNATGSIDRYANYSSGNSRSVLNFIYTVVDGDNSTHLHYTSTSSLSANGGTIRDNSSNDATLTLPSPGSSGSLGDNKTIVIDARAPTALLIACAKVSGALGGGTNCIDVNTSGRVTVQSTEIGTVYIVNVTLVTGEKNLASITGANPAGCDFSGWPRTCRMKSVDIISTSDVYTIQLSGMEDRTYRVYAVDALGNLSGHSVETGGQSGALGSFTVKFQQ
jgi:hypothetical protein